MKKNMLPLLLLCLLQPCSVVRADEDKPAPPPAEPSAKGGPAEKSQDSEKRPVERREKVSAERDQARERGPSEERSRRTDEGSARGLREADQRRPSDRPRPGGDRGPDQPREGGPRDSDNRGPQDREQRGREHRDEAHHRDHLPPHDRPLDARPHRRPEPRPDLHRRHGEDAPRNPADRDPAGRRHEVVLGPVFVALDQNRNGILESDEIDQAIRVLRRMDRNHDQQLSIYEIVDARDGHHQDRRPEPHPEARRDDPRRKMGEMLENLWAADRNHDRRLTREEAPEWLRPIFGRADLDESGFLDPDETERLVHRRVFGDQRDHRTGEHRGDGTDRRPDERSRDVFDENRPLRDPGPDRRSEAGRSSRGDARRPDDPGSERTARPDRDADTAGRRPRADEEARDR